MEKRFFLALLLTGGVLVLTPVIFPRPRSPAVSTGGDSSTAVARTVPGGATLAGAPAAAAPRSAEAPPVDATPVVRAERVVARAGASEFWFSTLGAAPVAVQADSFPALNGKGGAVVLQHDGEPLLRYRVVSPGDTLALDRTVFTAVRSAADDGAASLTFNSTGGKASAAIRYGFARDGYLASASVEVAGVGSPAFLLVDLPSGFDTQEADSIGDRQLLAYAVKPLAQGARGTPFAKLDPGEQKLEPGPLVWAVAKSKYFLVGLLVPENGTPFAEAHLEGGGRTQKMATNGRATVVMPLDHGRAAFEIYAGPQSWERLHALRREFETANPYGGFLQPIVQPFATIVMRIMLWLKKVVRLDYGWVLVIFGVAVRILMWPLNQSAMRTSLKMQRVQPELMEVQKRLKSDPQKQQQEIMRVYREHGMSPFSAFSGCVPMLIPMPVFFALFFVFQNTIEFRGVPFLWLGDISLRDPFYILPLITGASMFVLSWIGMRGAPKTQQTQMMLYLMPAMFTVFLLNTAGGLSIYYFVQQLAAIPQQWLIANERAKAKRDS